MQVAYLLNESGIRIMPIATSEKLLTIGMMLCLALFTKSGLAFNVKFCSSFVRWLVILHSAFTPC